MTAPQETRMVAVDGRDALLYVIVRPGADEHHVIPEAAANGISKKAAALILRRIANLWDPQEADQ